MATKASEIGVRNPCHVDWTKMTPAEGGRFCGDCKKVVRDLSKMSEVEARQLVAKERYEGLCVRMLVDRDGNVFFGGDKLVSASLLSKAKRAAMAAAAIALPLATNACDALGASDDAQTDEQHLTPMQGGAMPSDDWQPTQPTEPPQEIDAGADGESSSDSGSDAAPDVIIYK